MGRLGWQAAPAAGGASGRRHERGLEPRWLPVGRRLASCGEDGTIRLWGLERGKHVRTLRPDRPYERLTITGVQGLTQAEIATLRALGAIEDAAAESP